MPNLTRFSKASINDATKTTSLKSTAAGIVTAMATDVSNSNFGAARAKAAQLEDLYGKLSQARPPSTT